MKDFTKYWDALSFAIIHYGKLKRKSSGVPYIIHPVRITSILRAAGFDEFKDEDIMISALFHDLIEDTETTSDLIEMEYGAKIASIVDELSKPEDGSKEDWLKNFGTASKEAKIVKMADRIDNLLDMEMWPTKKRKSYAEQAKLIVKNCSNANVKLARKLQEIIDNILNQ